LSLEERRRHSPHIVRGCASSTPGPASSAVSHSASTACHFLHSLQKPKTKAEGQKKKTFPKETNPSPRDRKHSLSPRNSNDTTVTLCLAKQPPAPPNRNTARSLPSPPPPAPCTAVAAGVGYPRPTLHPNSSLTAPRNLPLSSSRTCSPGPGECPAVRSEPTASVNSPPGLTIFGQFLL
jgi:hypothetical protein